MIALFLRKHVRVFTVCVQRVSLCSFYGVTISKLLLACVSSRRLMSAAKMRAEGRCPLTPEEAVLMLASLGFKRSTRIFLAGAHIYGGESRMITITSLYPNLVTKEDLLTPEELAPFVNRSSQVRCRIPSLLIFPMRRIWWFDLQVIFTRLKFVVAQFDNHVLYAFADGSAGFHWLRGCRCVCNDGFWKPTSVSGVRISNILRRRPSSDNKAKQTEAGILLFPKFDNAMGWVWREGPEDGQGK